MESESLQNELVDLAFAVCDGVATDEQIERIEQLLAGNPDAQVLYLQCIEMHLDMDRHVSTFDASSTVDDRREPTPSNPSVGPLPIVIDPSSASPYPLSAGSFLPTSFLFSYGVAAAIVGIGIAVAWVCKVSVHQDVAGSIQPRPAVTVAVQPQIVFVGRITGIADCQWADPKTQALGGARVPLGRKYALAAGFMEITYDSGAKVILEGPCEYIAEAQSAGHLLLGKLTAKVEKSDDRGTPNPQAPGANHEPLFAVRTPTAIVTDLGTEFGVECDKTGVTSSVVFRGSVKLEAASSDGKPKGPAQVLYANQSARVEKSGKANGPGDLKVVMDASIRSSDFARRMPRQTVKSFDLLDGTAGGSGRANRRDWGVDPATGRFVDQAITTEIVGDRKYHRVDFSPFLDGVFIPDGSAGPVQVDSAGHTCDEFPHTTNSSPGSLWVGGRIPNRLATVLGGVNYSDADHAALFLHANEGITFNLDAIRRANPGCKLIRFRAAAGNTETASSEGEPGLADFWVLVDGQVRYQRQKIDGLSGAFYIAVPIRDTDRFLTLVGTDAGDGVRHDWILFGDPRIEMITVEPARPTDSSSRQQTRKEVR